MPITNTSSAPSVRSPQNVTPPAPPKASQTTSSIPTGSVVQPLSVADYALAKKPEGVGKSGEKQVAFKTVGDPKGNHVVVGQAKVSGDAFVTNTSGKLQAQARGEASLTAVGGKFEHKHEGRLGSTVVKGEFNVGARVSGETGGTLSRPDGAVVAHAKADGFAGARGELQVEQKQGKHFSESLQGTVRAGAMASAGATFAFEPKQGTLMAKVGYSALAGAQESVSGEVKLGVFRFSGGVSAKQGVGSAFGMGAGIKDGRFMLSANVGAALGVGAGVNVGVAVNGRALKNNAHKVGHAVKESAHTAGHAVKESAHTAGHAVKEGAHRMGHSVKESAHRAGHSVKEGFASLHRHEARARAPQSTASTASQS